MLITELLREIDEAERDLKLADKLEKRMRETILKKARTEDEWFWEGVMNVFYIQPLREGREKLIKRNKMYLAPQRKLKGGVNQAEIDRAREYPIDTMIDFRRGVANCLWHNEKTASLHYYEKDNHVHCFGCGKSADSIDVYRQLNGTDFISAVKALQ